MKDNLHEEILRQLSLIRFDRSKTILEQGETTYPTIGGDEVSWRKKNKDIKKDNKNTNQIVPSDFELTTPTKPIISTSCKCPSPYEEVTDVKVLDNLNNPNSTYNSQINTNLCLQGSQKCTTGTMSNYMLIYCENDKKLWCVLTKGGEFGEEELAWVVETAHWVLPLTSLILYLTGVGIPIAVLLEIADSALYLTYDDNPYMAAFCFIFAIAGVPGLQKVPGFKQIAKEGVEQGLEKIFQKVAQKQSLKTSERIFVKNVLKNPKLLKEGAKELVIVTAKAVLKTNSPTKIIKFVNWLKDVGYLTVRGRYFWLNAIFGINLFDYYVSESWKNGKCASSISFLPGIVDLVAWATGNLDTDIKNWNPNSVKEIIKRKIDFLQPWTMSEQECMLLLSYQILKNQQKENYSNKMANYNIYEITLQRIIEQNEQFSNSVYSLGLARVQNFLLNVLQQTGFSISEKFNVSFLNNSVFFNNIKNVDKIEVYLVGKTGKKLFQTFNNSNKINQFTTNKIPKNELTSNKIYFKIFFSEEYTEGTLEYGKINSTIVYPPVNISGTKPNIKFGYLSEEFEKILKEYQAYSKLPITGNLDNNTLNKILKDIKNKKFGTNLVNFTDLKLTSEEAMIIQLLDWKEYEEQAKKELEEQIDLENMKIEQNAEEKSDEILDIYVSIPDNVDLGVLSQELQKILMS